MLVAVFAATSAASANTITTVAGGGNNDPVTYNDTESQDPLLVKLPSPRGLAWSGDPNGMVYVVDGETCGLLWFDPDPQSGDYGLNLEGGTLNDCNPLAAGYPTLQDAMGVKLDNPCCVASDGLFDRVSKPGTDGPLVASTGSGHVNFYSWFQNKGKTELGSTQPADCAAASTLPTTTGGNFCSITGLARQMVSPYSYAVGEVGRQTAQSDPLPALYLVTNGAMQSTASLDNIAALAFDRLGNVLVGDGNGAVLRYPCCPIGGVVTSIAGARGFSGFADATHATNARFTTTNALAVGFDGVLYVADTNNCRIRRVGNTTGTGAVTTIAGNGCVDSSAPLGDGGPSTAANLDHPLGLTFAPTGLVISDTGHARLRLIDRTSIVDAPPATADSTPSFDIRSLDTPAHLECTIDGNDVPCDNLGTVADGQHTLAAWENGNSATPPDPPDPTPALHTFKVDTTAPTGLTLRSPAAGASDVPLDTTFSWDAGSDAVTGIDHYELWLGGAKDGDVALSACGGGVCAAKPAQSLTEGPHDWHVVAVDGVGNRADSETRTFQAGRGPDAFFRISPNPVLAGRPVTFDGSTSSDDTGVAHYEWDLDGDGSYEVDSGAVSSTSRVYQAATSISVTLRVTDTAGRQSTSTQLLKVTNQQSGTGLVGISINNGAQYTKDPKVSLLIKAPPTANAVLVSNDGGFLAPATFPVASTISWRLDSSGPERLPKTVYVKFMLGPIISDNFTDDIILDEVPPVVQSASLASSARASIAARRKYVVKVKARDTNSGVGKLQVTANKKKPGKLLAYRKTVKIRATARPRFVRARDRAGNFSGWKKLR